MSKLKIIQPKNKPQYHQPSYKSKPINHMSDSQLVLESGGELIYDIEVYPNYFLIAFKSLLSGKILTFEITPDSGFEKGKLRWVIDKFLLIGFNNLNFDRPLMSLALSGLDMWANNITALYSATQELIDGHRVKEVEQNHNFKCIKSNEIDLIEVAPGKASLKLYAGRLHAEKMQDLPFDPHQPLTKEQAEEVKRYCVNDLDNTHLLYDALEKQLNLRKQMSVEYNTDLRSKSDAQIAESVIGNEIKRINKYWPKKSNVPRGTILKYNDPGFLSFQSPQMIETFQTVLNADFIVHTNDKPKAPPEIEGKLVQLGSSTYRMGIGGLHSCEKSTAYYSNDQYQLMEKDVTSYYPFIILNQELHPQHLGKTFLEVYKKIVYRRLEAKQQGNSSDADSLKIVINGSFGKFGSSYSILFSPQLLLQVTITGQLALLMLIEMIENIGIEVVSGNTDGIVIKCPHARRNELESICGQWESITNFNLETTIYKALFSKDVNNYIAIKENDAKRKGLYSKPGLMKNPTAKITTEAVINLLTDGTPIEQTIKNCDDITKFLHVRTVRGGAIKDDSYIGKVVRWYYKKGEYGTINYKGSGYNVPKTEGAWPLMELNGMPIDINYDKYIEETTQILYDVGYLKTFRRLFE